MRIGILTFPNSSSVGAALQMYALYKNIEQQGHEAEIINYNTPNWLGRLDKKTPNLKSRLRSFAVNFLSKLFIKDSRAAFEKFERRFLIKYPSQVLNEPSSLAELSKRYDRIIVGSDQVWNPVVTRNDRSFYLDFCKESYKKATYAPSFGISAIDESEKEEIASLLNDFTYLSARERQGVELIREITGKDVPLVLDPTFLISKPEWEKLAVGPKKNYGDYVLYFTIKPSPKLYEFAQRFSAANGCKLVTIGGKMRDRFDPAKFPEFGVGPQEFLGLVKNAKYVVTNSFHGTAFSIILHKNFYVEYSTDSNSRLMNIVDIFGLHSCVVKEETLSQEAVCIDYAPVDAILDRERSGSKEYLSEIVKEVL